MPTVRTFHYLSYMAIFARLMRLTVSIREVAALLAARVRAGNISLAA